MKRLSFLFLVFCILSSSIAQETTHLLQSQLTVEVRKRKFISYSDWHSFITDSSLIGVTSKDISQSKEWKCYKGEIPISEAQFYRIAGYPEQAKLCQDFKNTNGLLKWGCGISIVTGSFLVIVGTRGGYSIDDSFNIPQLATGLTLNIAGLIMGFIEETRSERLTSVSYAMEVADDYNKKKKPVYKE